MVSYTPILKLIQPDFDQTPWDEQINDDLSILDAAFGKFMVIPGMSGTWQNATAYLLGQVLVDSMDSSIWSCSVGHTSAAAPTTFAQDRAAHPTYWVSNSIPQNYVPVGGGTMTGPLTLSGTPTGTNQAATKAYVDGAVSRAGGPFLPQAGGTVTGNLTVNGTLVPNVLNVSGTITAITMSATTVAGSSVNANTVNSATINNGGTIATDVMNANTAHATSMTCANIFASTSLQLPVSGGYIVATGSTVDFVMDTAGWRWEYVRSNGVMRWINGATGQTLLSIDSSGNLICKGSITPSGAPVLFELEDRVAELEARIVALEAKV